MPSSQESAFLTLGERPVGRLLLQYALPAIVAMAASSVYNIVDGIFIGQGVGKEAIMGLALTSPLMSLLAAFGAMIGVGASTLMSLKLGERDYETAQRILGNVIVMNVVLGLALGLLLLWYIDPILCYFGASEVTLPYARDFMTVILWANPVTHLYLGLNAQLRATSRPRSAMYATIGTVMFNILFAPIFIFWFGWGIQGAAAATILAQGVMLFWELRLFSRPEDIIHLNRGILKVRRHIVQQSILIGMPQFLVNLCACLVAVFITRSLTEYGTTLGEGGGDIAVGAFGICNRLVLFVIMVVIGVNQAMQPIAGYNFGAKKYGRVLLTLRYAMLGGFGITLFGFLVAQIFARPLVSLFASDAPELVEVGVHALRTMTLVLPLVGMQIVAVSFFQSIGSPNKSIFLSTTRQLLFLLPAVLLLPRVCAEPLEGVWYAQPVSDAVSCVLTFTMLAFEVKKFRRLARGEALAL